MKTERYFVIDTPRKYTGEEKIRLIAQFIRVIDRGVSPQKAAELIYGPGTKCVEK